MIRIKQWPKGDTVDFDELTKPIVGVLKQLYKLTGKYHLRKSELDYNGYDRKSILHCAPDMVESLSREYIERLEDEQGISPLELVVGLAVQLGYEQGVRHKQKEIDRFDEIFSAIETEEKRKKRADLRQSASELEKIPPSKLASQ